MVQAVPANAPAHLTRLKGPWLVKECCGTPF
jgi:hypothetical protein